MQNVVVNKNKIDLLHIHDKLQLHELQIVVHIYSKTEQGQFVGTDDFWY